MKVKAMIAGLSCFVLCAVSLAGCGGDSESSPSPSASPSPTVTATASPSPSPTPKATASAYPNRTPSAPTDREPSVVTKTITGMYTGQVDSNSIEITLEDDFEVLHLNDETRKMLEEKTLTEGDTVTVEYEVNEKTGERTILNLQVGDGQ